MAGSAHMLQVEGVEAFYGRSQILFGASLEVEEGQVVTLMGRNGMGKSTLIKCILGLLPVRRGEVRFKGIAVTGWASERIARLGIGLAPEGRQVFPLLSVEENLVATARKGAGDSRWTLESVYRLFPRLRDCARRRSTTLSGGEQQMLSIGRALMTNPLLLILDEATEGLAPLIRLEIWGCVKNLKSAGLSILVIDKNLREVLEVADRHFIIEKGSIVWSGRSAELTARRDVVENYLGV